jgi:hypothetical protein
MARQLFTARALELCYDGLALPDIDGFMKFPALPEAKIDLEEEMIQPDAYSKMLDSAAKLEGSNDSMEREMGLVNRMLRELGRRNSELLAARGNWLLHDSRAGRWFFDVRDRLDQGYKMKGVEPGKLPVSAELLAPLKPRLAKPDAFLILPDALPTHRYDLIHRDHNAWLKPLVGEIRSGKGNHRLRKYVATMIVGTGRRGGR